MIVWLVTELFYPEENATGYILTHIANALAKKYEVSVICGPASYGKDNSNDNGKASVVGRVVNTAVELNPYVKLHRFDAGTYNKNSLISRLRHQIKLSFGLKKLLKQNLLPGDKVLMVTNPAPLLLLLPKLVKRKGSGLYIIVHDVFPENTIPAGLVRSSKSFLYKILKRLFDRAYQKADKLLALGRDMQDVLVEKLGKNPNNTEVVVVENWAEDKLITPHLSNPIQYSHERNLLTIQFAGNLGRVQGLDYFLRLFKEAGNDCLVMSFWGDGAIKKDLQRFHLDNPELKMEFHPKYSRTQQNDVLNETDISLITLAEGMYGLGVPSKSYNIMAAGKPILFIGDLRSEIARVVLDNGIGFCFEPSDKEGIIAFLRGLTFDRLQEFQEMGNRARTLAETIYSQDSVLLKYIAEIQ